ncbi:helix-turn-helix domain-containing protein [Saccharopolyspora pogona]|uniref:helix-turn-helix domain-containing protein n=1 Tax=Saccharopolyspora pogona TaxID=333966 RepID=UPI001682FF59|nr:helix-turn-helix transcriptional regulator [Saccharopolyspora pogona]
MVVHTTEPAPVSRRRPWFELRAARIAAGHHTQVSLAKATGLSKQYLCLLENGTRSPNTRVLATIAAALGVPRDQLAPRPLTESPDDVARLLRALPRNCVRASMPLEPAGTQFGDCEWCADETGIGDARVRISWDVEDSTEGRLYDVCPACMFAVVDEARSESDAVTVEYTIVAPAETLPAAA